MDFQSLKMSVCNQAELMCELRPTIDGQPFPAAPYNVPFQTVLYILDTLEVYKNDLRNPQLLVRLSEVPAYLTNSFDKKVASVIVTTFIENNF
jgi:hypothetical protein